MATSTTKYLKIERTVLLSRSNTYGSPIFEQTHTEEIEVTRYKKMEILAATGGTTVDLSEFGAIDKIIVSNRDATNYVEGTFRNTSNGSNDNILRAEAGESFDTGGAITVANDIVLTANSAAVECILEVYGTV